MIKTLLLLSITIFLTACVNKHGISAKYYSECKEYYDLQGYYHKDCGEDDIVTYKTMGEKTSKIVDDWTGKEEKPKGNVW
ncbi:MAG: hypothetical protein JJW00_01220 [Sulfurimonas sp.]|nr:hypothetical protein [Sulfurimonas sp.]